MENRRFVSVVRDDKRRDLGRPITGLIHKDRIWEQWYDEAAFESTLPKMSQKDYLFLNNADSPNRVLIDYRGKRQYTVAQFHDLVDEFERAFAATEYKVGDVVCTIALSSPELYAIKYAATSLGLITCNLNILDAGVVDNKKNRLVSQIEKVNPRFMFIMDVLEEKAYKYVNEAIGASTIKVIVPMDYSLGKFDSEKVVLDLKRCKNHLSSNKVEGSISLSKFLKGGRNVRMSEVKEVYEEGMPCNISYTSGTTGVNKAVLLSHDANNALAYQQMVGKIGMQKGDRQLALLPPFLAFWDADIVHAVLAQCGTNIIEMSVAPDKVPTYFEKHENINVGIFTQYTWSTILVLPKEKLREICKNVSFAVVGGERCDVNEEERFYNMTGIIQTSGYGASEINTTFSVTHPNCSKLGTAGIPLPFNNVRIVDDDFKDTTYDVPGRLLITGPCLMEGYYNRPDLTEKAIIVDEEGTRWYNTGDYAVMDTDGVLTVIDRYISPVEIKTPNGVEKVNLLDIAEILKFCRCIKNCKMSEVEGQLILHVSFRSDNGLSPIENENMLIKHITEKLPVKHYPDYIVVHGELPRTAVGKVDYKKLRAISKEVYKNYPSSEKLTFCRL